MTNEDKIKVLAELDGWQDTACNGYVERLSYRWKKGGLYRPEPPPYLTSYDAIIPLLKKCWEAQLFAPEKFYQAIPNYYPHILTFVQHITPEQLADALIKAVGKWKNDPNDTTTIIRGKEYQ